MRIGIIHATSNAVFPLNNAFKSYDADIEIVNFVDENIQGYANNINGIDAKVHRDFFHLAVQAEAAGVDVIVVACTVLTPIVNAVKPFIDTPIIAVDRLMLEHAVKKYKEIGVVVTNAPTAPAIEKQLNFLAKTLNEKIEIFTEVDTEAMKALKAGNVDEHNHRNYLAAKKLFNKGCEVIVLAQITQASAENEVSNLGIPVLTSPKEAMKNIRKLVSKV